MTILLRRIFLFAVLAWAWTGSAAADYVFVFYDEGTTAGVYDADTLESVAGPEVGANVRQAVGVPDASDPTRFVKIYIVNDNAVRILEPEPPFATIRTTRLSQAVNPGERPAVLTPDARWLLVPGGNTLFVFNAQSPTDSAARSFGYGQDEEGQDRIIASISVEPNGDHAYLAIAGSTDVHSVGLQTDRPLRLAGPIVLPEAPTAVTIAPSGAGLYAASSEGLHDVDFHTGMLRSTLPLDFDREPLRFLTFHGGAPLNRLILAHGDTVAMPTLATFTLEYGALPPFAVDKILAPTQDRLFLLNGADKQIFEHVIGERDFDMLQDPRTRAALRSSAIDMEFDLAAQNLFILDEDELLRFSADVESLGASVPLPSVPAGFYILSTVGATPDEIAVYGGNQQEAASSRTLPRPIAVRVSDANGVPVFGAEVAFSSTNSNIAFEPRDAVAVTNRFGIAEIRARAPTGRAFSVQAQTADGREAVFNFNDGPVGKGALTVLSGDFQSAPENSALPRSIRLQIAGAGVGIPSAQFTITPSNDSVSCPNTIFSGANGIAAFSCRSADAQFQGFADATHIEVEDDSGRSLAEPLTIRVAGDENLMPATGNPRKITEGTIRGIGGETIENAVELRVLLPNGRAPRTPIAVEFHVEDDDITTIPHIAPSNSNGFIRADLKLGCRVGQGTFTTTLSVPGLPENEFDYEIARGPMNSIVQLQGNHQSGLPGERLSLALLALIADSCGNPFENVPVTWKVTPPDAATLEAQTLASNHRGQISSLVRLGSRPGDFSVTVSTDGDAGVISTTFSLTVIGQQPPTGALSFVNGASFVSGWTPGSLGSIFGTGLLPGIDGVVRADALPFPTTLRNIRVLVNGAPAPILSLANVNGQEQINIQVPFSTPAPADSVEVAIENSGSSASFSGAQTFVVQPGIFEYTLPAGRFAAALHADYSLVQPTNPARPGEFISLFFTGGGPVDPAVPTNAPGPAPVAWTTHPASVTLDGAPQETSGDFLGSFYAPALAAVYQLNFQVGEDTPAGNREIRIAQNGAQSQSSLLPVQR